MATQQVEGWWSRHWKWAIPCGCLTLIAAFVGFAALIAMIVFAAMRSSDAYKQAVAKAEASPAVVQALGKPIREGYFTSGSVNVNGASGSADLAIPIAGPKGKATVYLEARKSAGEWSFSKLVVRVEVPRQDIDLLHQNPDQPVELPTP